MKGEQEYIPPEDHRPQGPTGGKSPEDAPPKLITVTARELMRMEFPPVIELIPGILGEGLVVLAGPPKLGKSFLALAWGYAVASGGMALGGIQCTQAGVLYIGLEDTRRRIKGRLEAFCPDFDLAPEDMHVATEMTKLGFGGLPSLKNWLEAHRTVKLVVIDTFGRVKPSRTGGGNAYEEDTILAGEIQGMAHEYGITLLVVHHNRKLASIDVFERISGSQGLPGAADTLLVLSRERGEKIGELNITGRDVEERTISVEFDAALGTWRALGKEVADESKLSTERQAILDYLRRNPWSTPHEVAADLGKANAAIRMALKRMKDAGHIVADPYGKYNLPPPIQLPPEDEGEDS